MDKATTTATQPGTLGRMLVTKLQRWMEEGSIPSGYLDDDNHGRGPLFSFWCDFWPDLDWMDCRPDILAMLRDSRMDAVDEWFRKTYGQSIIRVLMHGFVAGTDIGGNPC